MVDIKFEIFSADLKGFDNLAGATREATIAVEQHMTKLMEDVRTYPPPNSPTYVRTNELFRNWRKHLQLTADGIAVIISNEAFDKYGRMYTAFVHGDASGMGQRALHAANGWINLYREHIIRQEQLLNSLRAIFSKYGASGA